MSRFSFNRKRVKLKKVLGIRARLALLALILVTPADAGARPFAGGHPGQADRAGLGRIHQPRQAQRRYAARSDLVGRDRAEIGGLYPRFRRRRRPQLRHHARQPARQSALDPQPDDRRRRWPHPVLDQQHVCRSRSQRPALSHQGARDPRLCFQRLHARQTHQYADGDGGLSGVRHQPGRRFCRSGRRQSRLDVEDHEQSRQPARRYRRAGRQCRNRAGGAGGSGQHDRPSAGHRAAAVVDRRPGDRLRTCRKDRFPSSPSMARNAWSLLRALPARNRA